MIVLNEVAKTYDLSKGNSVAAVRGVTLEIRQGEFAMIIGRSGSGKTTLLNLAAGLTRPTTGEVLLDGVNLWELTDSQLSSLRGQKIGFVFQFPSLLPALNVFENVILPATFGAKRSTQTIHERARQLLHQVGLADKINVYPRQLSAGQQQRVVIARSLINQPQVLLADEPTSNLDEKTEQEIMELFRELHADLGITVAMVTHTRQLVSYGTRFVEMAEGQIVNGKVPMAAKCAGYHVPRARSERESRPIESLALSGSAE
ncbi:MAG: ABC transporter ATP-binding protein [Chloroflexi bacterium]|nr:ABC transporter ATP-binding protein [Chloroflexota bacterium]